MNDQQITGNNKKSAVLTLIGIIAMILLTVTKVVPPSEIAGYSVFVGIAFFFLTEAAAKTQDPESGLRFTTIAAVLKKPGVIFWMLLPSVSGIVTLVVGNPRNYFRFGSARLLRRLVLRQGILPQGA